MWQGEASVRWHFLSSNNSVGKLCVSWALPFVEYVAVWALKLPVVYAPLRSLQNRSPLDFLQHIPTYSKPTTSSGLFPLRGSLLMIKLVTKFFYGITGIQTKWKRILHTHTTNLVIFTALYFTADYLQVFLSLVINSRHIRNHNFLNLPLIYC